MLALLFSGSTVNLMSLIGVILLMGIVAKNAILLIDFTKWAEERGVDRHTALIEAGGTRLRPILMTSVAIVAGMLPTAFGAGEGGFERLTQIADKQTKEFHSTLGTILMSYGLVGLAFFGLLLLVIFGRAPLASIAYLGPVMLYSITHVGVRFSEFWIFLALVYAQARYGSWGPPAVTRSADAARR